MARDIRDKQMQCDEGGGRSKSVWRTSREGVCEEAGYSSTKRGKCRKVTELCPETISFFGGGWGGEEEDIVCYKWSRGEDSLGLFSSCEDFTSLPKNGR